MSAPAITVTIDRPPLLELIKSKRNFVVGLSTILAAVYLLFLVWNWFWGYSLAPPPQEGSILLSDPKTDVEFRTHNRVEGHYLGGSHWGGGYGGKWAGGWGDLGVSSSSIHRRKDLGGPAAKRAAAKAAVASGALAKAQAAKQAGLKGGLKTPQMVTAAAEHKRKTALIWGSTGHPEGPHQSRPGIHMPNFDALMEVSKGMKPGEKAKHGQLTVISSGKMRRGETIPLSRDHVSFDGGKSHFSFDGKPGGLLTRKREQRVMKPQMHPMLQG